MIAHCLFQHLKWHLLICLYLTIQQWENSVPSINLFSKNLRMGGGGKLHN